MLNFPTNVRLYLATQPVDLRRSYDGLSALVDGTFGKQAMSGDLFIFMNRRANQVWILFWERDGYVIMMKCLEQGKFRCHRSLRAQSGHGRLHRGRHAADSAHLQRGYGAARAARARCGESS